MINFKNKKVLIMGLGLHGGGVSVTKFFLSVGAKVTITDLKTKSQLKDSLAKLPRLKLVLGKHREEDFKNADLIIKNPDVPSTSPYLKIARKNNIPIKSDIEIFFDLCPGEIIGVTGTKGKSTIATLIYRLMKEKYQTVLAGNIGVSPLEFLAEISKDSKIILELSSFALEKLKKSPHIAVITNIFPDHLNRYKNFSEYKKVKENIFKYQTKKDILILNENPAQILEKIAQVYKIPRDKVKKVLRNFKGIPHRQEFIADKNGVKYFNDTTATNPGAVKFALKKFRKKYSNSKIILIAGGEDKRLSYRSLAKHIEDNIDYLVFLPGSATELLKRDLKKFPFHEAKSMQEAVRKASSLASKGDIVLLSPGASSFNLFKNEFDRGDKFKSAVDKL